MDTQLRTLERNSRAFADVDEELSWLNAQLRAGVLSEDRIASAAAVGHLACARLLGHDVPQDPEALLYAFTERFAYDLDTETFSRPTLGLRYCAAVGREFVADYGDQYGCRKAVHAFLRAVELAAFRGSRPPKPKTLGLDARRPVTFLYGPLRDYFVSGEDWAYLGGWRLDPDECPRILEAAQRELVPWLLRRDDPILQRWVALSAPERKKSWPARDCNLAAELRVVHGAPLAATISSLSVGGAQVETSQPLPLGDALYLDFRVPGFPGRISAVGRVVEAREGGLECEFLWAEVTAKRFLLSWSRRK